MDFKSFVIVLGSIVPLFTFLCNIDIVPASWLAIEFSIILIFVLLRPALLLRILLPGVLMTLVHDLTQSSFWLWGTSFSPFDARSMTWEFPDIHDLGIPRYPWLGNSKLTQNLFIQRFPKNETFSFSIMVLGYDPTQIIFKKIRRSCLRLRGREQRPRANTTRHRTVGWNCTKSTHSFHRQKPL